MFDPGDRRRVRPERLGTESSDDRRRELGARADMPERLADDPFERIRGIADALAAMISLVAKGAPRRCLRGEPGLAREVVAIAVLLADEVPTTG
ncbi:MAG: hypothetical protein V4515_07940 [Chloroflexota bacterium]